MAHALRWYNQIKSYSGAESKKFPGVKDASKYMAAAGEPLPPPEVTMTTTTSICSE